MKMLTLILFLGLIFTPFFTNAQDDVKRPNNIGVNDYDSFKNSSFDIKDESASLKDNVGQIDKEVKSYSGIINTIGIEKLKANLKALKESKEAVKKLTARISALDEQGKALLEGVKNVKPRTKSPAAGKNTKSSVKGLTIAKDDLKGVGSILEEDIKLISDELKSRGEPIE